MNDSSTELYRAIRGNFAHFELEEMRSRNWASATFTGTRHTLTFRLEGDGAEAEAKTFLDGLEEREFDLRGHVLADIALVSREREDAAQSPLVRISIEALTLEDA